ncbi:protein phosphatase 2C isoform gamma [Thecamonas trahens ATCC 50062]|uniref:Protein phosphatase 2C isoform gamma n=1 Tax=Thecamonas trahens ATCC 50062 TaxID=461836 RepID=A0A0L0DN67_THETB|nr:protein phosphatase 2C isoform gamma [Thecamonas trahens ATCC 50062]KNC52858.1 protein phosphatase 2C isoform gamma [Thecamonas trahens ATCC 50062]|eukprot:XP_013754960.1 protein phosphatase 2C isoform gamma [Thecamonas trahens ATCC 50062]
MSSSSSSSSSQSLPSQRDDFSASNPTVEAAAVLSDGTEGAMASESAVSVPAQPAEGTRVAVDFEYGIDVGVHAIRGVRPSMEDHHIIIPFAAESGSGPVDRNIKPRIAFCGVYDGHGGKRASEYVSKHLHNVIATSQHFAHRRIREAIEEGFAKVEEGWMSKAYEGNMEDGTTAVVALLVNNLLWVANVGDSECVLVRNGAPTCLSIVHNAKTNHAEEVRVVQAGGRIRRSRLVHPIWAVLNIGVTRSIGASSLKAGPNTDGKPSGLIAEPDINCVELTHEDEFLILACDGLWDVLSYQDAADFVSAALADGAPAADKGSLDNITALVVVFNMAGEVASEAGASAVEVAGAADDEGATSGGAVSEADDAP